MAWLVDRRAGVCRGFPPAAGSLTPRVPLSGMNRRLAFDHGRRNITTGACRACCGLISLKFVRPWCTAGAGTMVFGVADRALATVLSARCVQRICRCAISTFRSRAVPLIQGTW